MPPTSITPTVEFLRRHAPFDQMLPAHLEFMAKRLKLGFYAKGEVVTGPDDGPANRFYIIKQGRVRGEAPDGSGSEGTWELDTGECFPIGALLARRPMRMINRAQEDTFCFELGREDFEQLLHKSPVFHDFCTRRMANLLDNALRGIQARSATRVSEANSLNSPIEKLIQRRAVSCTPDCRLGDVLKQMNEQHIGSMVVTDSDKRPQGVFTLHDVIARVVLTELSLDTPIGEVISKPYYGLRPEAPAYEAALMMARYGVGHLCVVDRQERLIGVISERDLFSLQRVGLVNLSRRINRAENIEQLARMEGDIHQLVDQMIAQGASVDQLTQIITELNDGITQRVIHLTLAEHGDPGIPFTWLSFGSEGRVEQTLKTDQDNGILFSAPQGVTDETARETLLPLATKINNALDQCGFPLCKGNIMASNPECCLSLTEWQARFSRWIDQGTPEHLLKSTIFFDFRPLWGDESPAKELRSWLNGRCSQNSRFRKQMAANALRNRPPLGLFGDFKVSGNRDEHPHTLNLKFQGITPFVDAARIFALAYSVNETNTVARLLGAAATGKLNRGDVDAWAESYQYIQLLRMRNHRRQEEAGEPLSNYFDPDQLNDLDSRILKEAFRQARKLQSKIALEYQL